MAFLSLRLCCFRNLAEAEVDLEAQRIFLVGENGQGKTNVLEALYYLSFGSSFRGSVDGDVPRRGEASFSITGKITQGEETNLPPELISVSWKNRNKEIRRGEKLLRDRKDLVELNPSIVFCHEDFSFSAGEPERRRFFFDQTAGLVSAGYIDLLRDYKRVLRQRNAVLREGQEFLLDLLDEQLAVKGLELSAERKVLEADFSKNFSLLYEQVSLLGTEVRLEYRPSWRQEDLSSVRERLAEKRREELALKTSLSGPHRDRWTFVAEGRDFAATASTGQLRLLSLVLRSAQARYYTERKDRLPVLLLDDVLLELDPGKRRRFLESLPESTQAVFTFLPGEPWEDYLGPHTRVYRVSDGRLTN